MNLVASTVTTSAVGNGVAVEGPEVSFRIGHGVEHDPGQEDEARHDAKRVPA